MRNFIYSTLLPAAGATNPCPLDGMVFDTIKFSEALDDTSLQHFLSHKHYTSVVHFDAPDRLVASTWSATETVRK
jgi:hypothetical protein